MILTVRKVREVSVTGLDERGNVKHNKLGSHASPRNKVHGAGRKKREDFFQAENQASEVCKTQVNALGENCMPTVDP
jgi:hypothetical protein